MEGEARKVIARPRGCEGGATLQALDHGSAEYPAGPLIATGLMASISDPQAFRSGRDLSAWIGLVPSQPLTFEGGFTKLR